MKRRWAFSRVFWIRSFLLAATVLLVPCALAAEEPLTFIGADTDPIDTEADRILAQHLQSRLSSSVGIPVTSQKYPALIQTLRENTSDPLIVRATPYVFAASQLLGARLQIIATYERFDPAEPDPTTATPVHERNTTYSSWLVLNRAAVDRYRGKPEGKASRKNGAPRRATLTLSEAFDYIKNASPTFVFHDRFSASGYFLPAEFLRREGLFTASRHQTLEGEAPEDGTLIATPVPEKGERLLARIASGEREFAATWDFYLGQERKKGGGVLDKLYLIELPQQLPNDLLVANAAVPPDVVEKLRSAIRDLPPRHIANAQKRAGNIARWIDMSNAPRAQNATRWLIDAAAAPQRQSVIAISYDKNVPSAAIAAVKLAIWRRREGFTEYDSAFHKGIDYFWHLQRTPDGAVAIHSRLRTGGTGTTTGDIEQDYEIAYASPEDLTTRVVAWMLSDLAIVAYVWSYNPDSLIVFRDFDHPLRKGDKLRAQAITWQNLPQNQFTFVRGAELEVAEVTQELLRLVDRGPRRPIAVLDPLSRDAVRIFIDRTPKVSAFLSTLSWSGAGVLLLFGFVGVWESLRKPSRSGTKRALDSATADIALSWTHRTVNATDLIWCDRPALEQAISDLQDGGVTLPFNTLRTKSYDQKLSATLPALKIFNASAAVSREESLTVKPDAVSNAKRVQNFLNEIARQKLVAPFTGRPELGDELKSLVAGWMMAPTDAGRDRLLGLDEFAVAREHVERTLSAYNFYAGLASSESALSLFRATWRIEAEADRIVLTSPIYWEELRWSTARPRPVTLQFSIPLDARNRIPSDPAQLWMLGTVDDVRPADSSVTIVYKCIAVLR